MNARTLIDSESTKDFLRRKSFKPIQPTPEFFAQYSRKFCARAAIGFAEHVLPKYEQDHPEDRSPRVAVEAAKAWLADPSAANAINADRAATDANNVAHDADRACHAAVWAATIAANAAHFAHYAAHAATWAAEAAGPSEKNWQARFVREMLDKGYKS